MKTLVLLSVSLLLAFAGNSFAEDKVVVIPMGLSNNIANSIYGGGFIIPDGSIDGSFGKPFSVTNTGTGQYTIHVAGLRPGCTGSRPISLTSCFGPGFCSAFATSTTCASGDTDIYITTYSVAAIPIPSAFSFLLLLGEPQQAAASATSSRQSYQTCEFNAATGVETCR